jgi:hypothetical protein
LPPAVGHGRAISRNKAPFKRAVRMFDNGGNLL